VNIGAEPTGAMGHLPRYFSGQTYLYAPVLFLVSNLLAIDRNYLVQFLLVVASFLVIK